MAQPRLGGNAINEDEQLALYMAELYDDPLEFVRFNYPWGVGPLDGFDGPDVWQEGFLRELGQAIRLRQFDGKTPVEPIMGSTVSGHGIGKSAITAWLCDFARSTRPHSKGVVTANTAKQLATKTWSEIIRWGRLGVTGRWFDFGYLQLTHKHHKETWRLDGIAWRENQPEAFAGLHAASSTAYVLVDEASGVPRSIFETALGGMTDGEPWMLLFGNGTRNSGYFYDTHNRLKHRFHIRKQIDSRTVARTNKKLLDEWEQDHGAESDFFKIRVRGMFPNQSSAQFIATDLVERARKADFEAQLHDPVVIGVDVARFGDDSSVIAVRKGRDARSIPWKRFGKLDTVQLATHVARLAAELQPDAVNVDGGGVGGPVVDMLRAMNVRNVFEINFGSASPNRDFKGMASYMWGQMRDALKAGMAIPDDNDLQAELTVREFTYTLANEQLLESKDDLKARGEASPDMADALALTYALPLGPRDPAKTAAAAAGIPYSTVEGVDYDPFASFK